MIYCAFVFLQTKFFTFCGNDERLCVCRKSWFAWRGMLEVFQRLPTIFFHHIRTKQILVSEYLLSPLFYYNCTLQCTYIFKVKFKQYKQVVFYTLWGIKVTKMAILNKSSTTLCFLEFFQGLSSDFSITAKKILERHGIHTSLSFVKIW